MKYLLLKLSKNYSNSGITQYLINLNDALQSKNLYPYLVTKRDDALVVEFKKRNFQCDTFKRFIQPTNFRKSICFLFVAPYFFVKITIILLKNKYKNKSKTLYCVNLGEKLLSAVPAKILGYNIIWLEHTNPNYFLKKNIYKPLYALFSRFAKIIAVSKNIKEILSENWIKKERIQLIYPGISIINTDNKFEFTINKNKKFIVGTVSSLNKKKGVHMLLKAVDIAREFLPGIQLIIVGNGPEKKNLLWLSKTLSIEDKIRFVDCDSGGEEWILKFDIFIVPDVRREAFGLNILRAMACGKPIIAPEIDGISEIINHNDTGIVIEPNNPYLLSQSILNFYNNQHLIELMGKKAKNRVKEEFNIDKMVNKYIEVFKY